MNTIKKYNIFIFLSTFSRGLIETFAPLLLYNLNFSIKEIILYFFLRYLFAIPIIKLFSKLIKKNYTKLMILISSITIGITYYILYTIDKDVINITILSLMTTINVYSYWMVRNYYMMQVISQSNTSKDLGIISIINMLAILPASYVGAFILNKYDLLILIIIVFILNILSIIPLIFIHTKNCEITKKQPIKVISKTTKIIMFLEQFKTIILSLFPLYIYIYISNTYTYIGKLNIYIGILSLVLIYAYSKKINKNKKNYLKNTITILTICFLLKILIKNQYLFLLIAIIEGVTIKIEELAMNSKIYKLGKDFDYILYINYTETIYNISRFLISLMLLLLVDSLTIMLLLCIIGFFICSLFKFDIEQKK